jgi:predicted AAA+ superfamily ATPase
MILEDDPVIREENLEAYDSLFLDEEIRVEAAVRNVGLFAQFLHLAALESGRALNFDKIAQDIGVSRNTISSYYQVLEDCLLGERFEPISHSETRKRLVKTPKYLLFDVGVRRVSAKLGTKLSSESMGYLFEEYIGLELLRLIRQYAPRGALRFWRDSNGPEVDWIVENEGKYLPIEVKWTNKPTISQSNHLNLFINEYPAKKGYIVCRIPHRQKLSNQVDAIPWEEVPLVIEEFLR